MRRALSGVTGVVAALLMAGCQSGARAPSSSAAPATSLSKIALPQSTTASTSTTRTARRSTPNPSHHPRTHRPTTPRPAPRTTSRPAPTRTHHAPVARTGTVVVLDPGHNGGNAAHPDELNRQVPMGFGQTKPCNTTGTSTDAGYPEHAFTFDVSQRVSSILRTHGVTVYLTRPNDIGFGPCVNERAGFGNREHAAAVVSIHADGAPSSGYGFHVCTASRQPDGASDQTMARSHDMALDIHDALTHGSGLATSSYIGTNGYFPRSDLAGLNLSVRPTTFLELGNMRNAHDAGLQSSSSGRQQIAAAVAAGILGYLAHP